VTLNRQLRYPEHDGQPLLDGVDDSGGHLRGDVPVMSADRTPEVAATAAGLVAHEFVNHPGGDAGVLQPGRVGVPEVVGAVQLDRLQQGITGDRQRRPPAGQRVLVVVVDPGQAGSVQLAAAATVAGRIGRRPAAVSRGELVDAPSAAQDARGAEGHGREIPRPLLSGQSHTQPPPAWTSPSRSSGGAELGSV
jgi:hypothetical protein